MTKNQESMRLNFRRPLLTLEAFALMLLGFVLYPALQHFSRLFFQHEVHAGKIAVYDSGLQHQLPPVCEDAWLFLRRSEISHELVQALELPRLGRCGEVRLPARKRQRYTNYVSRDPGFVLPDQSSASRGNVYQTDPSRPGLYMRHQPLVTTPHQLPAGRIPETGIRQQLSAVHLD